MKMRVDAHKITIDTQQITIDQLFISNDLSFSLISDIYKFHLFKATAHLIFWSLNHHLGHYVPPETVILLDALIEMLMKKGGSQA